MRGARRTVGDDAAAPSRINVRTHEQTRAEGLPGWLCPPLPQPTNSSLQGNMRACSCAKCSGGTPNGISYVPERTWFKHRCATRGLPPRSRAAVASSAAPPVGPSLPDASLDSPAPDPLPASSPSTSSTDGDDSDSSVADEQPPDGAIPASPAQELHAPGPNGVRIPSQVFKENIDDVVLYTFVVQHCRSCEGTEDYLR